MRLFEITNGQGTYAGYTLNQETIQNLLDWLDKNDVPEPLGQDDFHITLLYSRKGLPRYKALGELEEPIIATPKGFDIFGNDEESRCLVVRLDSPEIIARHRHLMVKHDATYDYDEYHPHLTLTYAFGDNEIGDLSPIEFDIILIEEYKEGLDLDSEDEEE